MTIVAALFVVVCVMALMAHAISNKHPLGWALIFGSLAIFALLTFVAAPLELGAGKVPPRAEEFTKRLEAGVVYRVLASKADGDSQVFFVEFACEARDACSYRAVRVKAPAPPQYFTLINGQPVTVSQEYFKTAGK